MPAPAPIVPVNPGHYGGDVSMSTLLVAAGVMVLVVVGFFVVQWAIEYRYTLRGRRARRMSDAEFYEAFHKQQERLRRKHQR